MKFIKFIFVLAMMCGVLYFVFLAGSEGGIDAQLLKLTGGGAGEVTAEVTEPSTDDLTADVEVDESVNQKLDSINQTEETTVTTTGTGLAIDVVNNLPECSDGIDNDSNGVWDYGYDNGCSSESDDTEATAECSDGIDNDGDGVWDYGYDSGCSSPVDDDEKN